MKKLVTFFIKKELLAEEYFPVISIITKKTDDKIEIRVKGTGNRIPQNIVDKIFQPFFTTTPQAMNRLSFELKL